MHIERETLSGWGNQPRHACRVSHAAVTCQDDLAPLLSAFRAVTPRGSGRAYGDASLSPADGVVLSTRANATVLAFDSAAGRLTAGAGATLERMLERIIPAGWFLPVTPGTRAVTLGGALASNVHGKNHHRVGGIAGFVERLRIITELGLVTAAPDCNPELFYATLGGYGATGLVLDATLRLRPIQSTLIERRRIRVRDLDHALAACERLDQDHEYSVLWLDVLAPPSRLGRGVLMLGDHRDGPAPTAPLAHAWRRRVTVPRLPSGALLNRFSNRLFNLAYAASAGAQERTDTCGLEDWFFPLDRLAGWNRLYGPRGLIEYQCALPDAEADTALRRLLEHVRRRRLGSFLAVCKRMSADTTLLPFALPGWTLALDFKAATPGLPAVLRELDDIVLDHGGRVYLAKDARLPADTFRAMYPEYRDWLAVVERWNPNRRFASRLTERLGL